MDIYFDEQILIKWLEKLENHYIQIDKKLDRLMNQANGLNGEKLLDDYDLSLILHISVKTLERYRHNDWIPYLKIKGKAYYKLSEVETALKTRTKLMKEERKLKKKITDT